MENGESYQERQENEKVCIEAIYMDDFRDESKKGKKGMAFVLHLMPQQGTSGSSNIHCTVDMRVICPPKYPSDPPQISFENTRGLSEDKVLTLKKKVEKLAKNLKGEEMILQLAQQVQQFLHAHNVPGMKSLFDEMQRKEEKKREQDALLKQKQREQEMKRAEMERKELEEEMVRRQEALLEESRMRREKNHDTETPAASHEHPKKKRQPDPLEFISSENSSRTRSSSHNNNWKKSSDVSTDHSERQRTESFNEVTSDSQVIALRFNTKLERNINRGCILEDQEGGQVYIGMDNSNGHLVVLREWQMKWKHGKGRKPLPDEEKSADNCMKQLASVEQELLSLLKLSHPNLVHYLAMNTSQGKDSTTVQLLMEFVGSGTLRNQIRSGRKIPFSILRQYAIDLLAALSYLHKKAVVHKQLSPGSVFIDVSGQLKIANYSLVRRLNDLCELMSEAKHTVRFSEEKTFGARGGKKADVLKFGLILLAVIREDADVQMPCELPPDLPPDLQDFLERCLDTDERSRASIHSLEEHSFVKDTLPVETAFLVTEKKDNDTDSLTREISEEQVSDVRFLGNSRLHQEFEVLGNIGKGGFGNVFRVRNRLDGNAYAIKRIVLNPKSKDLNKKITREVKLLSRLNHENVVRYFNSWIEVSEDILTTDSESDPSVSEKPAKKQNKDDDNLGLADNIEDLAPRLSACGSLSWSVSAGNALPQESSESSSDDEDDFGMSFMRHYSSSDSDGIDFEADGETPDEDAKSQKEKFSLSNGTEDVSTDAEISTTKYLYIQMEFCEKSTLRTSIDENLYKDEKRMWRYLREILEGLVHIHSQGMIHRDLKPDNIFLASNDLVKIGDFGLATSEQKVGDMLLSHSFFPESSQSHDVSADAKDFLTGKVGTALYVSPELSRAKGSFYNQKVDLYSLGIIFFEMCMPPLATGMERVQMLGKLRQENIEMPENCDELLSKNKKEIVRWLLDHDPSKRPTAHELLESQHLPPLEMEEARFQEMIRQTVSNDQSRGFKHLMNQLFSQTPKAMDDILYDVDIHKGFSLKNTLIQKTVFETLTSLFERHGAVRVNSPLLLPKNALLDHTDSCCYFMDNSGSVVALPFDLRIPFARNVARNSINKLKRYAIERVYRERKIHRCHPRELTECAFDIITNVTSTLLPEAEVMYVVSEILEEFPSLEEKKVYFIRVNHTLLLQAILTHCGIPEEKHKDVMKILAEVKGTMIQMQTHLQSLSLSEQELNNLFQYVELECSFKELSVKLKPVTKGRGPSAFQAKQALHELESIISQVQIFGVQQKVIVVAPSLVHKYFSSFVFQFVARVTRKHKKQPTQEVLAAGGRYDHLIPLFKIPTSLQSPPVPKAVGVSIHFDKIVTSLLQDQSSEDVVVPVCDVLVCVMNSSYSIKECIQVVRNLWNNNIKADILYDASMGLEEIQDYCRAFGVSQIVVLKDQLESGMIWVRSLDREKRVVDSKVTMPNLVEYLQQKLASDITEPKETLMTQRSQSFESHLPTSQVAMSSITILPVDTPKLESNTKRRIERQIQPRIQPVIENLSSKVVVQVVAVDLPMEVVKTIVAILDLEGDDDSLDASVKELCNRYNRYRKYIPNIADCIQTHWKSGKSDEAVVVILYSYKEDGFKVLM